MNKYIITRLLLLITLMGMTACVAQNSQNSVEETQSLIIPTPEAGKAIVHGVITNSKTGEPIAGVPFLARALSSDNPDMPITVSFSYQSDPGANYDDNSGVFIFENIEPGDNYVILVVSGPGSNSIVIEPGTDQPLIISVGIGETLNLGNLTIVEE